MVGNLFEESIRLCVRGGFVQDAALARELYAQHQLEEGDKEGAAYQTKLSMEHFQDWGALQKVKLLRERHIQLTLKQ